MKRGQQGFATLAHTLEQTQTFLFHRGIGMLQQSVRLISQEQLYISEHY